MLTASYNEADSYSETGGGNLNLHVKNDSAKFLETRVGVELSKLYLTEKNTKIRPQFSASYGYDLIGDQQKSTNNFVGQTTTFASEGAKVAQGSFKVGTGFALYTTDDVTFSLNYGLEYRTGYTSNSGWLRIRYGF